MAQKKIKDLSGDLQTAHRESIASKKRTEVEKFKGRLKEQEAGVKISNAASTNQLTNAVKLEGEKLRIREQEKQKAQNKRDKSQ